MKKQRTYVITSGSYDNYRIVAFVVGPARPALSTLKTSFDKQFGNPVPPGSLDQENPLGFRVWQETKMRAEERMRLFLGDGAPLSQADYFVRWLGRYHGFTLTYITEMNL